MPLLERGGVKVWQRRERGKQLAIWAGWLAGALLFAFCWQMISANTMWVFVWDAPRETAYPSTFVIDQGGVIRFAKVSKSHGGRAATGEVLKALGGG